MDHEKLKKVIVGVGVAHNFINRIMQIQSTYLKSIEWRLSTTFYDGHQEKVKKMVIVLNVAFYFLHRLLQIQSYYQQLLQRRLTLAQSHKKIKRNPPEPRTPMYYERVVLRLSSSTFRSHFRLTKTTFVSLCNLLGPIMAPNVEGGCPGRPNTPIERQILPVLWLLATPDSYRSVADRFDLSKGTLFHFFKRFIETLNGFSSTFIRWPTKEEIPAIRKKFYKIVYFDDYVIGAIDGTYIVIPAPTDFPEVYRTRKCNFAQTLQPICLPTLHFTSCFVGFPGSVSDRRIFENSPIYRNIMQSPIDYFPSNEYIIGDKAYPVFEWLQTPFIRRFVLNDAQQLYNRLLSATRQVIERAFALLFGRFRRLKMLDMTADFLIPKTVIACCVLHNMSLCEKNFEDFIKEGLSHVHLARPKSNVLAHAIVRGKGDQKRGEVAARLHRQKIIADMTRQSQIQQA